MIRGHHASGRMKWDTSKWWWDQYGDIHGMHPEWVSIISWVMSQEREWWRVMLEWSEWDKLGWEEKREGTLSWHAWCCMRIQSRLHVTLGRMGQVCSLLQGEDAWQERETLSWCACKQDMVGIVLISRLVDELTENTEHVNAIGWYREQCGGTDNKYLLPDYSII